MALFNKPDQQTNPTPNTTVISAGTRINGKIGATKALHIDGNHEGSVNSKGNVTVGKTGSVTGDIAAQKLVITGAFQGTADCDEIEVLSGGVARGKMIANSLTIDHDCQFEGESIRKNAPQAAKPKPAAPPKPVRPA